MSRNPSKLFAVTLALLGLTGPMAVHLFLPILPAVRDSFGISNAMAQFSFTIALFTMAFMTLVYGALSDRFGRRPVLLAGLSLFLLGSALSLISDTPAMLIIGRLIQAGGAACGITLSRTIARDAYGPERLVKVIAYLMMFYALGPMIAPIVGGILMDSFGWRSVFWFALAMGAVITVFAATVLYETRPREQATAHKWGIFRGYVLLFSQLRFTALVFQSGFSSGAFFAMSTAAAFIMQNTLGRPATEFGLYFALFPAGYFIGTVISSRLGGRVTIESMVLAGSILQAAAITAQSVLILAGFLVPLVLFIPGLVISIAQGMSLPNAQAGAIQVVPSLAGSAAGAGVFIQIFCGASFAQLYGWLADGTPVPMVMVVSTGAALSLVSGVIAFLAIRRHAAT